ncbi:MAG: hypothetical protein LBQ23_00535 [Puniceicoccales bacterium]|nr:hypothetical protein [Puniceicoccales bacterium]
MNDRTMIIVIFALVLMVLALARRCKFKSAKKRTEMRPRPSLINLTINNLRLARAQISDSTFHEFSKLLSFALKVYVRGAYKIPSMKITSEETINKLLSNAQNDWSVISLLTEVLKLTDAVKYSQRKLSKIQQKGIYKKACKFVLLSERFFRAQNQSLKSTQAHEL